MFNYFYFKFRLIKTSFWLKLITDKLLKIAADANSDDKISSKDYVRIKNIIMKEDED